MYVSTPEGGEPEHRQVLRRVERELLFRKLERSVRMLACERELSAVDGNDRDRQMILGHLQAVLDRDVVRLRRLVGRELPAAAPELEPRETPERAGTPRLVSLAPLLELALEQRAGLASPRRRREGVHDGERRLLHELRSADRRREVVRLRGKRRRIRFADHPAEDRLDRLGTRP